MSLSAASALDDTVNRVVLTYDMRAKLARLEAVQNELEWRKSSLSFNYFWENYWHIEHPSLGASTAPVYPGMADLPDFLDTNIHACILKGRQIGCSTFVAAYVFWKLFFHEDPRTALFFSKTKDDAVELLASVTFGYERLPDWMLVRGPSRKNNNTQNIKFSNGSKISSLASKKNAGRSRSAWIVVLDEWAFYDDPKDAWSSVEPVTDIGRLQAPKFKHNPGACGGRMIALSTANKAGDFFNDFWDRSVKGANGIFAAKFLSAMIPPLRDQAWYEEKKASMPDWQLHREYPIDPALAFIKSGNPIFDVDLLTKLKTADYVLSTPAATSIGKPALRLSSAGVMRVFYNSMLNEGVDWNLDKWVGPSHLDQHRYVISADTAQGVDGGDYSSGDVIRLPFYDTDGAFHPMEQVAHIYGQMDPDEFAEILVGAARFFNEALIIAEANNHGLTTLHCIVRQLRYRKVYYRKQKRRRKDQATKELGFYTSSSTKPPLIDNLKTAIRESEITINSETTRVECINYVRSETGKMEGHPHDDCVMSLALGVEGVVGKVDDFRMAAVGDQRSRWTFSALATEEHIRQNNEKNRGYVV